MASRGKPHGGSKVMSSFLGVVCIVVLESGLLNKMTCAMTCAVSFPSRLVRAFKPLKESYGILLLSSVVTKILFIRSKQMQYFK